MNFRRILFVLFAALASGAASAHATGASWLAIDAPASGALDLRWDIPAIDLQLALEIDRDGDGRYAAEEIAAQRDVLARYAAGRLAILRGGVACALRAEAAGLSTRNAEPVVSLRFAGRCERSGPIELATALFFESPSYSALFELRTPEGRYPGVLTPGSDRWLQPPTSTIAGALLRFLAKGTWHVLIGYDHIVFLLLLLLPSVLRGVRAGWQAVHSRREIVRDIVRIVTAFTLAHSVTLGFAATGTFTLPERPIEIAIAASIVFAGLLNLFPVAARLRLPLAFAFGFVHGFGFANAFGELDRAGFGIAPMLAGFNLGVEAAQLLIVACALPVLLALRRAPVYRQRLMPALSVLTAALGAFWLIARF